MTIAGRRGDSRSREGPGEGEPEPKSFLEARLIARLRALEAAREAILEGEEESGGTLVLMLGTAVVLALVLYCGGGNVMLLVLVLVLAGTG